MIKNKLLTANYNILQTKYIFEKYNKLTKDWFEKECNKFNGKYYISNQLITTNKKEFYCASANRKNNKIERKPKDHSPENCELLELALNIAQHDVIKDISESIFRIFELTIDGFENTIDTLDLLKEVKRNFNSEPRENGVTALSRDDPTNYRKQKNNLHIKYILTDMFGHHTCRDKKKEYSDLPKYNLKVIRDNMFQLLIDQKFLCHYSGVPMTIENGPRRFSLERLDNNKPHFDIDSKLSNAVWICRIFNAGHRQWSRYRYLEIFLSQIRRPMSDDVRRKAEIEFSKCEKPMKDVVKNK